MMLASLEAARNECCAAEPRQLAAGSARDEGEDTSFGSYIRALRKRARVSLTSMATRIGLNVSHYHRIEFGERPPPSSGRWRYSLEIGADASTLARLEERYRAKTKPVGRPSARVHSPGQPGSDTWDTLPWEEDDWCWYAVTCHPEGLSLEQVAALMGWAPERVRNVEREALAKLALEPGAVEAMEVLDDRDTDLAIWAVAVSGG